MNQYYEGNMKELSQYYQKYKDNYNNFEIIDQIYEEVRQRIDELKENNGDAQEIEDFFDELKKRHKELKEEYKNEKSESAIDDEFLFQYDFSKYELYLTPIESLNTEDLPYPIFLRDKIIPIFHPLPYPEIQNPILAAICLINPAALPPLGENNSKEAPLPNIYIQGESGSGKSQIQHLIEKHFPPDRKSSVKGSTTGAGLLETLDSLCKGNLPKDNYLIYPSVCIFENFYLANIERWQHWAVELLATERAYAWCERKGKDAGVFFTFVLKVFSSVEYLQPTQQKYAELYRRTIRIFTEKGVPEDSVSKYSWDYCKRNYIKIWKPENIDKFFEILSEVVSKPDDSTNIPPEFYPPSQVVIAVGVFTGIWESLEEAENAMTDYWSLVRELENKRGKPYLQNLDKRIESYYREYEDCVEQGFSEKKSDNIASQEYLVADEVISDLVETYGNYFSKKELSEGIQTYLASKGFIHTQNKQTGQSVFRRKV